MQNNDGEGKWVGRRVSDKNAKWLPDQNVPWETSSLYTVRCFESKAFGQLLDNSHSAVQRLQEGILWRLEVQEISAL
jgi:hypothetical protein